MPVYIQFYSGLATAELAVSSPEIQPRTPDQIALIEKYLNLVLFVNLNIFANLGILWKALAEQTWADTSFDEGVHNII